MVSHKLPNFVLRKNSVMPVLSEDWSHVQIDEDEVEIPEE